MILGTFLELYLLKHYEDVWQVIPLVSIGITLLSGLILVAKKTSFGLIFFKGAVLTNALVGIIGVFLHLKENIEFEKEMTPNMPPVELWIESLSGALPVLAPGSLIALSLVGITYIKLIQSKKNK